MAIIQSMVKTIPVHSSLAALLLSLFLTANQPMSPPNQNRKMGNNHHAAEVFSWVTRLGLEPVTAAVAVTGSDNLVPQLSQYRLPAGLLTPHLLHFNCWTGIVEEGIVLGAAMRDPQLPQNLVPLSFSNPQ